MYSAKRKSYFGLFVAIATTIYAGYYFCVMKGYIGPLLESQNDYEEMGYALGMILVNYVMKDFVTFTMIAAVISFISFFANICWGYLGAIGSLIIAYFQLPPSISPTSVLAIFLWTLCLGLIISFFLAYSIQKKLIVYDNNENEGEYEKLYEINQDNDEQDYYSEYDDECEEEVEIDQDNDEHFNAEYYDNKNNFLI